MSAARTLNVDATEAVAYCGADPNQAGRCRLTVSKPVLKAPMVSALVATM